MTWKTVSAADGHLATGSFAFGIGVAATAVPHTAAVVGANPPSPFAVVMRLVLFVGLVVVVGAVVLSAYAFGTPPLLLRRLIAAGAVLSLVGTVGVAAAQALGAGIDLGGVFSSSLGRSLLARAVPAIVLLASAMALLFIEARRAMMLAAVAGIAALAAMAVDVLNSHAAAESPATLNEFAQWLHIGAVGVWIGGLVALLVVLRRHSEERHEHVTRRLSTLAGIGLVLVAATGVFRAVIEVQTWAGLVTTAFGVLVLLKIGLLLILAGLGAFNRYGNIPRLPQVLRRLRRVVTTEALVALGALTVAAALVNVAPPAEYATAAATSSQPASVVVSGSDYATTVKVQLTISPGTAGFNTFELHVADYTTGATVAASKVLLQFTQPLRPSLGTSTLTLTRQQDGSFQAHGGNLSLSGIWEVAAIIENGEASTEVHLQVATTEAPPTVQVSQFGGGLPTVYTIQLASGMQAQVYLDPNRAGADEFHVTFIGATGNEVPIAEATIGMTPPSGTPQILVARRLDDIGHFVADATVPAGKTRFDILATTRSGQAITTYITITPGS
ncbi:MAG: CopD family protein [Candidatus Dormibacteraeota bacterium]|nr:CopD family protein [Candidatus Dormibacteraeota bacterium]